MESSAFRALKLVRGPTLPPGLRKTIVTDAHLPEKTTRTWSQHLRERSHVLIVIRDAVIEQVRERLRGAEMAPRPDENVIKKLKRLIEAIPGNISS
jgi:hypothetical protein